MRAIDAVPATKLNPMDVMAIIRDEYRYADLLDPESSPGYELSFDSTVEDWRNACDLRGLKSLGRALNRQYYISVSDEEWKTVLRPPGTRRLQGVCELIATRALVPVVRPTRLFGSQCLPGGAFLALRVYLRDRGADTETLRPSTALEPYIRRNRYAVFDAVRALAPNRVEVPAFHDHPAFSAALWVAMMGISGMLITLPAKLLWSPAGALGTISGLVFAGGLVGALAIQYARPAKLEWGRMQTFADLSRAIAASGTKEVATK